MRSIIMAAAFAAIVLAPSSGEARPHRHGHGLICGAVQQAYFHKGSRRALDWADEFPHVYSPAVDVVVVQRRNGRDSAGHAGGHVSRIVQPISQCRAIVADERGRYERDICSRLVALVAPGAGPSLASLTSSAPPRRYHGRPRRPLPAAQYVRALPPNVW